MAVVAYREVVGRTLNHKFGESPTASRKFVVTLDDPDTSSGDIIGAIGIAHLDSHPEWGFLKMVNGTVNEGSPSAFHAEVTYDYEILPDGDPNPLNRADVWSFSTSGAAVPAFTYYDGTTVRPLVNSAKDFFEGAMTEEAEVRATISGNRANFPLATAVAVTNAVNSDNYLGAAAHTWKCAGISAQQTSEMVNEQEVKYWQITIELVYRQSGWNLQLPNVGYNCIENNKKIRAYVLDPSNNSKRVPCANPVALNSNGSIKEVGQFPDILNRRVHKEVAFGSFFGTPSL